MKKIACFIVVACFPIISAQAFITQAPSFLKAVDPRVQIQPIMTVGDVVPRTGHSSASYRLVGLPDGMGLFRDGNIHLYVNHEIDKDQTSEPLVGKKPFRGAFVSDFIVSSEGKIISGDLAFSKIENGAGAMSHLCSAFMAGPHVGFDRPIFLTGEEATGKGSFDGRGGLSFGITGGVAYPFPGLGRFKKENQVVLPGFEKTFVIGLEDGPKGLSSQLYLYVGEKDKSSQDPMRRNGLRDGELYVLTPVDTSRHPQKNDESMYRKKDGVLTVFWKKIPKAADLKDAELHEASLAAGSFNFNRVEDGTYDRNRKGVFYFITTGGGAGANQKGRLYRLTLDPKDPVSHPGNLEILLEGDAGDPILSPDNLDANKRDEILIQEDFTFSGIGYKGRQPSIWKYAIQTNKLKRIAEIVAPPTLLGEFQESSGVIDASDEFGPGAWLVNVQAHGTSKPSVVEGGQILLLRTQP